jgi:hypothetical protein
MLYSVLNDLATKVGLPVRRPGEPFTDVNKSTAFVISLVIIIVWILIVLFVGKWLWNEVLCEVVSFAKPVKSVFQILGLFLLLEIIAPQ